MFKRLIACALGFTLLGAGAAWADDIVVVVNAKAPVQSLSAQEIKDIYLGETIFWGSTKVAPVAYPSGEKVQGDFLKVVLKISPDAYKKHWIKRIFREGGVPPARLGSVEEAISAVANTHGGIGFLYTKDLPAGSDLVREVLRISE